MTDDFAQKYGRWAVIAGASEGVGASLADQLAERGLDLVLIARNQALLAEVATRVRERHGVEVRPVVLDLTVPDISQRVAEATDGLDVGLVIYNAGAANRTVEFLDDSFEDSLRQIQLACIGPVALARHFAPAMRERGRGGIVLVGSLACLSGASLLAVYSAVKAFNVNFAEGLWAELRPHGVDVCCTPLGMTYTEAFQRMGVRLRPRNRDAAGGRGARNHREHRQRSDLPCGREQSNDGIHDLDHGPTYVGRTHQRRMRSTSPPSKGPQADARRGAARRQARGAGDRRSGAGSRRTADQTAQRGDLRVGCALHGPSELGRPVQMGRRPRHRHGPRVHRRSGRPRTGLLGRLPGRHPRHQPADHDPPRRGAARDRTQSGRAGRVRRADARLGGDGADGARRRAERLGRSGGRIRGGGVLRSLFWHQTG